MVSRDGCTTSSGSSTSGVAFYPGGSYPGASDGALFFADYSRQCIWMMTAGTNGVPDPSTRTLFRQSGAFPVDLATGPNGDLCYVDIGAGTVRCIRYTSADQPPVAAITPDQGPGAADGVIQRRCVDRPPGQPLTTPGTSPATVTSTTARPQPSATPTPPPAATTRCAGHDPGGQTAAAPFNRQAIVSSRLGQSTPATQNRNGNSYNRALTPTEITTDSDTLVTNMPTS